MYIHEIQKFTLTFAAAIAEAATTIMTTNFLWKQDNKNILGFFMTRAKKKRDCNKNNYFTLGKMLQKHKIENQ